MQNQEVRVASGYSDSLQVKDMPEYDGYDENCDYIDCRYPDEEEENQDLIRQVVDTRIVIDTISLLTNKHLDDVATSLGLDPREKALVENVLRDIINKRKKGFRHFFND